jgi:hypothetical protein
VEFNSFTGSAAYCLPGILQLAGYQTMASNAYNPSFFNTPNAYQGMGFAKVYFPREYVSGRHLSGPGRHHRGDGIHVRPPSVSQNLDFITPLLKENDGPPLFNYIMTVYGHFPHAINEEKRPQVLKMISSFKDQQLERAANQIFYRSEASGRLCQSPARTRCKESDHPGQRSSSARPAWPQKFSEASVFQQHRGKPAHEPDYDHRGRARSKSSPRSTTTTSRPWWSTPSPMAPIVRKIPAVLPKTSCLMTVWSGMTTICGSWRTPRSDWEQ